MNFKEDITKLITRALKIDNKDIEINDSDIISMLEVPKDKENGDYSFPCFKLAKLLKKAPNIIADEIKKCIDSNSFINDFDKTSDEYIKNYDETNNIFSNIVNANGFLNFYINKTEIVKETILKFDNQKQNYGKCNMGNDKTVLIEYSSPNIAKPFHIGHLKTTIIGHALYNIYKFLGFNAIRLNHLGDYGTQFAKLIEGYKRWGSEYDFSQDSIDKMADLYKRINDLCEDDENVMNECRETFKMLENGDAYCMNLWKEFKDLSLKEFDKIYDLLDVKFDEYDGESFYANKMQEVLDLLEKSGKLTDSNGAKIVDLQDVGIDTPCIVKKANGSSIYATRDLAAIIYRAKRYDYDRCLYVVAVEQSLYFKQIFAVAKYLGLNSKYTDGLEHVSYGMIRLPEGKMSTRKGNFVKVEDLLNEATSKVKEIMIEKNKTMDNAFSNEEINTISKQVGIGAVIFDDLAENRIKDQVFDLNSALNFNGETGPYIQYMAVRTNSVLEKAGYLPEVANLDFNILTDNSSIDIIKLISDFQNIVISSMKKSEPSIISRYLIDLSKAYSSFYNLNKIICDDKGVQDARLYITYMTKITLTSGLNLLGIEVPKKM